MRIPRGLLFASLAVMLAAPSPVRGEERAATAPPSASHRAADDDGPADGDDARLDPMSFRRIADVAVGLSSIDFFEACLELHPLRSIGVAGCMSTGHDLVRSRSGHLTWRPTVAVRSSRAPGWYPRVLREATVEIGLGAGAGVARAEVTMLREYTAINGFASLEVVVWMARHVGWKTQLDLGLARLSWDDHQPSGGRMSWWVGDGTEFKPFVQLVTGIAF